MAGLMDREERDHLLEYLNKRHIPFRSYPFDVDERGRMKQLGEGGFAIVYESHGQMVNMEKAIKVIGFQFATTDVSDVGQFEKEVGLQSKLALNCANILRIDDAHAIFVRFDDDGDVEEVLFPEDMDGVDEYDYRMFQFILMEKLSPVFRLTKNGTPELIVDELKHFSEEEVVRFAIDVGNALEVAHQEKIAHRDVKIENTFYDPLNDVYKLGDFGIARVTENGSASTKAGTRGNISPEAEVGGKYDGLLADIYSYGIMLYLLLNDLKYPGSDKYKANREVQYNPSNRYLPRPEHGSDALVGIVLKACAFKVEDRYASMKEVMDDLRGLEKPSLSSVIAKAEAVAAESLEDEEIEAEVTKGEVAENEAVEDKVTVAKAEAKSKAKSTTKNQKTRNKKHIQRRISWSHYTRIDKIGIFVSPLAVLLPMLYILGLTNASGVQSDPIATVRWGVLVLNTIVVILSFVRYKMRTSKALKILKNIFSVIHIAAAILLFLTTMTLESFLLVAFAISNVPGLLLVEEITLGAGLGLRAWLLSGSYTVLNWGEFFYRYDGTLFQLMWVVVAVLFLGFCWVIANKFWNFFGYGQKESAKSIGLLAFSIVCVIAGIIIAIYAHYSGPSMISLAKIWVTGIVGGVYWLYKLVQ